MSDDCMFTNQFIYVNVKSKKFKNTCLFIMNMVFSIVILLKILGNQITADHYKLHITCVKLVTIHTCHISVNVYFS